MLCFSYGYNMSLARLQDRLPLARFVAIATLPAQRLQFHKVSRDGSGKCDAEETGYPDRTDYHPNTLWRSKRLKLPMTRTILGASVNWQFTANDQIQPTLVPRATDLRHFMYKVKTTVLNGIELLNISTFIMDCYQLISINMFPLKRRSQ